jgi:exodeoxyribonuclease-3
MTKIYWWNVNGIRAVIKKGLFKPFIEEEQPDILCLQETKANKDQVEIDLPDYHEFWNSAEKKGYSGTAIFSKLEPLNVFNGLPDDIALQHKLNDGFGEATNEGRLIAAEYKEYYVLSVYTPNVKDKLDRLPLRQHWDRALVQYLKELEKSKPVIIGGDLNVAHTEDDLARPEENVGKKGFTDEERTGFQRFIDAGLVDTFRLFTKGNGHYTWWTHWANARARNIGWRIDYALCSKNLVPQVKSARIHAQIMGSDHCPVSLELK